MKVPDNGLRRPFSRFPSPEPPSRISCLPCGAIGSVHLSLDTGGGDFSSFHTHIAGWRALSTAACCLPRTATSSFPSPGINLLLQPCLALLFFRILYFALISFFRSGKKEGPYSGIGARAFGLWKRRIRFEPRLARTRARAATPVWKLILWRNT